MSIYMILFIHVCISLSVYICICAFFFSLCSYIHAYMYVCIYIYFFCPSFLFLIFLNWVHLIGLHRTPIFVVDVSLNQKFQNIYCPDEVLYFYISMPISFICKINKVYIVKKWYFPSKELYFQKVYFFIYMHWFPLIISCHFYRCFSDIFWNISPLLYMSLKYIILRNLFY